MLLQSPQRYENLSVFGTTAAMSDYYDLKSILCREVFYGKGYCSTGGEEVSKVLHVLSPAEARDRSKTGNIRRLITSFVSTQILTDYLQKKDGLSVLDVGSGPGGFAFYVAQVL